MASSGEAGARITEPKGRWHRRRRGPVPSSDMWNTEPDSLENKLGNAHERAIVSSHEEWPHRQTPSSFSTPDRQTSEQ